MTKLLSFADRQLSDTGGCQIFAQRAVDFRRIDQILVGDVQVAVVFHHAGIICLGHGDPVKLLEFIALVERLTDLQCPVAAEVEVNHGIAVGNGTDRSRTVVGDDERGQVLVDRFCFSAERFHSFVSGLEISAFPGNVSFPALTDHIPVCAVAVHGDDHTAAAGSDPVVLTERGEIFFKGIDVVQSGSFGNVTTVQQSMDPDLFHAFFVRLFDHALEVVDVAVNIPIGEETDEVERAACLCGGDQFLPGLTGKHLAAADGFGDQHGALGEDSAAAHGVVTDFTVAHVCIGGQTNGGAVGFERCHGHGVHELVEERSVGVQNGIAFFVLADPDTVHNDEDHGTAAALKFCIFCESFHFEYLS